MMFPKDDQYSPKLFTQTWQGRISQSDFFDYTWLLGKGGSMAKDALNQALICTRHLTSEMSATVFIQVGIVDATPRSMPKMMLRIVSVLFSLNQNQVSRLKRSKTLLKIWGKPWISPRKYSRRIRKAVQLLEASPSVSKIFILGINPVGTRIIKLAGHVQIDEYNLRLSQIASDHRKTEYLAAQLEVHPDGIHLQSESHALLGQRLLTKMKNGL